MTPLDGTIPAHGYYLISEAGGANGSDIPTSDASGAIAMAAGAGKVALFNDQAAKSGATPAGAIDFVGYGSANSYEGSGATKTLSATSSAQRRPYANVDPAPGKGNAWDTDDNAADFYVGKPVEPRNTTSTPEAPMVPVTSLQPDGMNIQFVQQGTEITVKGAADAVEPGSIVNVYGDASKGTVLKTATAESDGSFTINFSNEQALTSVFVSAIQNGLDESAAIKINLATASASVDQAKLSYVVTNGVGTLIGNAGSAAANATIHVYPNNQANVAERLDASEVKAGTSGDFNITINNAPDTVYVTQTASNSYGNYVRKCPCFRYKSRYDCGFTN